MASSRFVPVACAAVIAAAAAACAVPTEEASSHTESAYTKDVKLDWKIRDWNVGDVRIEGDSRLEIKLRRDVPDQALGFWLEGSEGGDAMPSISVDECMISTEHGVREEACLRARGKLESTPITGDPRRHWSFTPTGVPAYGAGAWYRIVVTVPAGFPSRPFKFYNAARRGTTDPCKLGSTDPLEGCGVGLTCGQDPTGAHPYACGVGNTAPPALQVEEGKSYTATTPCRGRFELNQTVGIGANNHVEITLPKEYASRRAHFNIETYNANAKVKNPRPTVTLRECLGSSCSDVTPTISAYNEQIYVDTPAATKLDPSSTWKLRVDFPAQFEPRLFRIENWCLRGKGDLFCQDSGCESPLACGANAEESPHCR